MARIGDMGTRPRASRTDRALLVLVGLLLAIASLVTLGLALSLPYLVPGTGSWSWTLPFALAGIAFTVFGLTTSWRLITGRRPRDGGALAAWALTIAGVCAGVGLITGSMHLGLVWFTGVLKLASLAAMSLLLVWRRFRRRT